MAKSDKLTVDIEEIYGFLNSEHTVCYLRVSWNGRKAKNEIRKCKVEDDGNIILGKGLALTASEMDTLIGIVEGTTIPDKGEPAGVDFDVVFRSGEGIMAKREAGYRTQDGFIALTRRNG